jgi:hypothetical protein
MAKRRDLFGPQMRQREVEKTHRGPEPRLVAVERDDRLGRDAPQKLQLILGDRGAERRDGGLEPGGDQRDHVHVALGHDQRLALARRLRAGP